jgi:RNA polymerase sigma factor (sigma-70 family)
MSTLPDPDFVALQQAARDGDPEAAAALYDLFAPAVRALARKLLDDKAPNLRLLYDSEDFKQDVMMDLFTKLMRRVTSMSFAHPEHLEAYLRQLVHSRFRDTFRHHRRQRFNFLVHRLGLDDPSLDDHPRVVARQPSAAELLEADEWLKELVKNMPPHYQRVLTLKVRGLTVAEIAAALSLCQRTVRRIIREVRERAAAPMPPLRLGLIAYRSN